MWETEFPSLSWEDPLEKEMATHSSILAWEIPWTEESDGLQPMASQRVRHNWATNTFNSLNIADFLIGIHFPSFQNWRRIILHKKCKVFGKKQRPYELMWRTDFTWCEELTRWKNPDAGKDWRWEEKGMTEDEMVGWHHQLSGHEFE